MTDKPTELLTAQDLADPSITQTQLAVIARARPDLRPVILRHPKLYDGLREWIHSASPHLKVDVPEASTEEKLQDQAQNTEPSPGPEDHPGVSRAPAPSQWSQPPHPLQRPRPEAMPMGGNAERSAGVSHTEHMQPQWQKPKPQQPQFEQQWEQEQQLQRQRQLLQYLSARGAEDKINSKPTGWMKFATISIPIYALPIGFFGTAIETTYFYEHWFSFFYVALSLATIVIGLMVVFGRKARFASNKSFRLLSLLVPAFCAATNIGVAAMLMVVYYGEDAEIGWWIMLPSILLAVSTIIYGYQYFMQNESTGPQPHSAKYTPRN